MADVYDLFQLPVHQCWGSVTFWCGSGSGSPDPYLWLMDPDPTLDPTPDPTPFFIDLKDAIMQKIIIFSHFFLITCPQVHHLQSKKFNFLQKFCVKMLFCIHYFSPFDTFMRKGKEPEPEPDPHLWLLDPDPEGQKACGSCGSSGSGSGSKSPTLLCMDDSYNWVSLDDPSGVGRGGSRGIKWLILFSKYEGEEGGRGIVSGNQN